MFIKPCLLIATATTLLFAPLVADAQDASALLDLLVKKKIVTEKEAQSLRADLARQSSASKSAAGQTGSAASGATVNSGDKWKLSTPITEIELYGDARVRFESRSGETGSPNALDPQHDSVQRNRERYRLRIGLRGTLMDDWFFGFRLETGQNPRSTNVTFGDDSSTASAGGGGPFARGSDGIGVGQAYLGYTGVKDFTFTAGKMPNPFVTTSMVWDPDLNPEGAAEQWKHTFKLGGGGSSAAATASYSKDGKQVASAKTEPGGMTLDLFANLGQFVYDDANPENAIGPSPKGIPNTDAWMLGWQVGAKLNFNKETYVQVAPTLYNYSGAGDTFNKFYSGDPDLAIGAPAVRTARNQTGINSLLVYEMPVEFGWSMAGIPFRIFGDFAVNFEGDERAAAAGHADKGDERYAYQIGIGAGKLKTKHDWAVSAWWQHTDQYSLDPNLVDSDIFDSRVNMEGFVVQGGYALSDAISLNLTYARGQQADRTLGTGGVGDTGLNPVRDYQLFQADLNWKF
jgi:hypothetical protein